MSEPSKAAWDAAWDTGQGTRGNAMAIQKAIDAELERKAGPVVEAARAVLDATEGKAPDGGEMNHDTAVWVTEKLREALERYDNGGTDG